MTGLNGTTQRGLAAPGAVNHKIRIDFDTNVAPHMPWRFRPGKPSDTVDIGARDMAFFLATNTSDKPITGSATFNVTPSTGDGYNSENAAPLHFGLKQMVPLTVEVTWMGSKGRTTQSVRNVNPAAYYGKSLVIKQR